SRAKRNSRTHRAPGNRRDIRATFVGRLCEGPLDAMFCTLPADVAQPVEARFVNRFSAEEAIRSLGTSANAGERKRPFQTLITSTVRQRRCSRADEANLIARSARPQYGFANVKRERNSARKRRRHPAGASTPSDTARSDRPAPPRRNRAGSEGD